LASIYTPRSFIESVRVIEDWHWHSINSGFSDVEFHTVSNAPTLNRVYVYNNNNNNKSKAIPVQAMEAHKVVRHRGINYFKLQLLTHKGITGIHGKLIASYKVNNEDIICFMCTNCD
jgi:hypothetical protein